MKALHAPTPNARVAVRIRAALVGFAAIALLGAAPGARSGAAADGQPAAADGAVDASGLAEAAHEALFVAERFPSAAQCSACHPEQYRQWSASPHAYAQLSPVFNAMQGRINALTNGTTGDFCIRCHTPVGMALGEPTVAPARERHPTSLEGVTCIGCHRRNEAHGKFSARIPLVEGPLYDPVFGPRGGDEVARVIASSDYSVVTGPDQGPGRPIHSKAERFFQLTEPAFCGTCHDVTGVDGFRLEEAFSEYKLSPAARAGTRCQDCHMGVVPGDPTSGFTEGPAAIVGGVPTRSRPLVNHMIVGPDHSVIHPALFPVDHEAMKLASIDEWLQFDVDAGWGTAAFEDGVAAGTAFPARWLSADERYDAREIVDAHLALTAEANERRLQLLRRGYLLGDVSVERGNGRRGLDIQVEVRSGIPSHNVPTGFDAERLVWLQVDVLDAAGRAVYRSGDLDANGDVRDDHSQLVRAGVVPRDPDLFSLQSKFITRNVRGGEREQVLAVNQSVDALPFLRPETSSSVLSGRPRAARIQRRTIEPLGRRLARYGVPASALTGQGPWEVQVRLRAAMVPVNLVHEIQEMGFDFGLSARDIADRLVENHLLLHERRVVVPAEGPAAADPLERLGE